MSRVKFTLTEYDYTRTGVHAQVAIWPLDGPHPNFPEKDNNIGFSGPLVEVYAETSVPSKNTYNMKTVDSWRHVKSERVGVLTKHHLRNLLEEIERLEGISDE